MLLLRVLAIIEFLLVLLLKLLLILFIDIRPVYMISTITIILHYGSPQECSFQRTFHAVFQAYFFSNGIFFSMFSFFPGLWRDKKS